MKIKVCGLRDPANIEALLRVPIDMAGFVFYPQSPRFAESKTLRNWIDKNVRSFGFKQRVGVFANAEIEYVLNTVHDYHLDFVQLHGTESPEYCRELQAYWSIGSLRSARFIKAFSVDEGFDFEQTQEFEGLCPFFLFDTKSEKHGGSGKQFNWSLLDEYTGATPFLLSGGIDEDSADQIRQLRHPRLSGVDINSKFETKPGLKDVEKVERFVKAMING